MFLPGLATHWIVNRDLFRFDDSCWPVSCLRLWLYFLNRSSSKYVVVRLDLPDHIWYILLAYLGHPQYFLNLSANPFLWIFKSSLPHCSPQAVLFLQKLLSQVVSWLLRWFPSGRLLQFWWWRLAGQVVFHAVSFALSSLQWELSWSSFLVRRMCFRVRLSHSNWARWTGALFWSWGYFRRSAHWRLFLPFAGYL